MKARVNKLLISIIFICLILVAVINGCINRSTTVVIRYAAWNLGDKTKNGIERRLINEFMKENPNVKIQIEEAFVKNYDNSMKKASVANKIPDVFMYAGNSKAEENGWCLDLSGYTSKDPEWNNIPELLRDSVLVKGHITAIPSAIYMYGYFYNSKMFTNSHITPPYVGMSDLEFENCIKKITNIKDGRIGLGDESTICDWYPASNNNRFGWFSWDGGKLNLNSESFKNGIKLARALNLGKYTYALLDDTDKKKLKGKNDWEAWNAGTVALKFDGTWSVNDYMKLPYDIKFAGIPGGRTCIVPDFLFISKESKHPKEAYEFAKFMSAYSEKGFSTRLKIAEDNNFAVATLPMIKNKSIIDDYFRHIKMKGIREVFSRLNNNSFIEETKVLPGYDLARWNYKTNISDVINHNMNINQVLLDTYRGNISIDEVADHLNYLANTCIQIYPQQLGN